MRRTRPSVSFLTIVTPGTPRLYFRPLPQPSSRVSPPNTLVVDRTVCGASWTASISALSPFAPAFSVNWMSNATTFAPALVRLRRTWAWKARSNGHCGCPGSWSKVVSSTATSATLDGDGCVPRTLKRMSTVDRSARRRTCVAAARPTPAITTSAAVISSSARRRRVRPPWPATRLRKRSNHGVLTGLATTSVPTRPTKAPASTGSASRIAPWLNAIWAATA